MNPVRRLGMSVVAAGLLIVDLGYQRQAGEKIDPAGSWKLSMALAPGQRGPGAARRPGGGGGGGGAARPGAQRGPTRQIMLNLTEKNGKISGDFVGFTGKPSTIEDAKLKDGELSFKVPQQMGPAKFTITFVTKLAGDKMQGTAKIATPAGTREFAFQGERLKIAKVSAAGTWKLRIALSNGPTFEPTLKITEAGNALKGIYVGQQVETPIKQRPRDWRRIDVRSRPRSRRQKISAPLPRQDQVRRLRRQCGLRLRRHDGLRPLYRRASGLFSSERRQRPLIRDHNSSQGRPRVQRLGATPTALRGRVFKRQTDSHAHAKPWAWHPDLGPSR